jgi:hypothetical protein
MIERIGKKAVWWGAHKKKSLVVTHHRDIVNRGPQSPLPALHEAAGRVCLRLPRILLQFQLGGCKLGVEGKGRGARKCH